MNAAYFRLLYAYNDRVNRMMLDAAAQLPEAELRAPRPGLAQECLLGSLAHVLGAELVWMGRWRGEPLPTVPGADDFASFTALRERWEPHAAALLAFVDGLTDEDVRATREYTNTRGEHFAHPLFQALAHVVNHGTQFRGEAAAVLSALGHSPGDLDLLAYLRSG